MFLSQEEAFFGSPKHGFEQRERWGLPGEHARLQQCLGVFVGASRVPHDAAAYAIFCALSPAIDQSCPDGDIEFRLAIWRNVAYAACVNFSRCRLEFCDDPHRVYFRRACDGGGGE